MQAMQAAKAQAATLARFKTPEACRYGERCRHKLSCSRHHGPDPQLHANNCACEEERCPLGHPLRAGRDRNTAAGPSSANTRGGPNSSSSVPMPAGRRPPPNYVCAKCKVPADHYLNECPQNTCYRCGGKGHIATHCTKERMSDAQRNTLKRELPDNDSNDSRAQLQRMDNGGGALESARGGGGMGGGGMRME